MINAVFWISLTWLAYVYVGYFAVVVGLSLLVRRDVRKGDYCPRVTIVIAAFNEAAYIEATIRNKMVQQYPAGDLDVLVVSDASTDGTDVIVERLFGEYGGRLRLLRQEPRQGKTAALNLAVQASDAEVLVFSDANSEYAAGAVRALVRNFADPAVGYVSGQMVYVNPDQTGVGEGSGSYMAYENRLRAAETCLGSIVGVDGGIDAVRARCYAPMRADQLPDFVLPLSVVEQGMRVVYEPAASVREAALAEPAAEFRMRVRVALRAYWAIFDKRKLLNPLRFPVYAWQLISHKVLRYLAFIPLMVLLPASAALADTHTGYLAFFVLQVVLYGLAGVGYVFRGASAEKSALLVPYYFVLLNAACLVAFARFLRGQKIVVWKPRLGS